MEMFDWSLLMDGQEIWRCWTADNGTYIRYAKGFGESIGWLYAAVVFSKGAVLDITKMPPIPKCLRCTNAKRYKKLLMSIGTPKKIATWRTDFVRITARLFWNGELKDPNTRNANFYQQNWLRDFFGTYGKTRKDFDEPLWELVDNLKKST